MPAFPPKIKLSTFNKMPLKKQGVQKSSRIRQAGQSRTQRLGRSPSYVRAGDTLVVWRLDRLGRSLKDLIEKLTDLHNRNIGFKSLTENIDTTTPGGKLIFHMFGALAEFERDLIKERTNAGLQAARARGRRGGRPKVLTEKKVAMARALYADKSHSVEDICKTLNIGRTTLYRYLKAK